MRRKSSACSWPIYGFAVALLCVTSKPLQAADCLRDTREVLLKSDSGAASSKVRQYLCTHPSTGQISVQFNRLNDLATSLLLSGRPPPEFQGELGAIKVVNNSVLEEFRSFVEGFGSTENGGATFTVTPPTGNAGSTYGELKEARVIVPAQGDGRSVDFPDPVALSSLLNHTTVPPRYTVAKSYSTDTALIWRYMDMSDLENYSALAQEYNRVILGRRFLVDDGSGQIRPQFSGFSTTAVPTYIRLYRHLAKGGLPTDFITIFGERDLQPLCGYRKYWEIKYYPRELVVDLVVIQNRSSNPVTVRGLRAIPKGGSFLRPMTTGMPQESQLQSVIFNPPIQLRAGERVAVATRLTWVTPDVLKGLFSEEKRNLPSMTSYSWGPELHVGGVILNDQSLSLEGGAANFLAVTTSSEGGSCPYLYVWNPESGVWDDTGKIIEKAKGRANEMAEKRHFNDWKPRFKLTEHEAEIARIKQVSLEVDLRSGKTLVLTSNVDAFKRTDEKYVDLGMGEELEFEFTLPHGVDPKDVRSSTLSVTGHYDRFTDLLVEQYGQPQALVQSSDWIPGKGLTGNSEACVIRMR